MSVSSCSPSIAPISLTIRVDSASATFPVVPVTLRRMPRPKAFEMEKTLQLHLREIEANKKFSLCEIVCLMSRAFCSQIQDRPGMTVLKCTFVAAAIAALYPAGVGALACFNTYRLDDVANLHSKDWEKENAAAQLFANLGQGVTYIFHGVEVLLIPAWMELFKSMHDQILCHRIQSAYLGKIYQVPDFTKAQKDFLCKKMNRELLQKGGRVVSRKELDRVDTQIVGIQRDIDAAKRTLLTPKNLLIGVARECIYEIKTSPWRRRLKMALSTTTLCAFVGALQHPLIYGTIACFKSFSLIPSTDILSSSYETSSSATALYTNVGHGVEYIASALAITTLAAKALLQRKIDKITREILEGIYDRHIHNPALSKRCSDYFYDQKTQVLQRYQS